LESPKTSQGFSSKKIEFEYHRVRAEFFDFYHFFHLKFFGCLLRYVRHLHKRRGQLRPVSFQQPVISNQKQISHQS